MKKIKLPYWLHSRIGKKFGQIYSELVVTIQDEKGKTINTSKQVCESYLQNFAMYIYNNFKQVGSSPVGYGYTAPYTAFSLIDSLGFNILWTNGYNGCIGNVNDSYNGLIVGTGIVAPTAQDRALGSIITSGVGAGQLIYQAQSCVNGVTTVGNVSSFSLLRTFVNSSGAPITVSEMGLCCNYAGSRYFLILRDLLSPSHIVGAGQTLTLQLITQITT